MAYLDRLKNATTLSDVAKLLGFTPATLSFVIYELPSSSKYTSFDIPKRDGTPRHIKAPEDRLRLLQRRLANLLYGCLAEIEKDNENRRSLAHGFAKGRSITTNATLHKRRRYVLNLDLEDFFPSFNFGRVRGFFIKDRYFNLPPNIATIIAQIACDGNELPQGSPCSPVITNLVGHVLDARLARFAKTHKCTYSRYADDITFSTSRKDFPDDLASLVAGLTSLWQLGEPLLTKIQASGFSVNHKKTRMQFRGSRQVTTGLLVNEKVNVTPEYYQTTRAMCHSLFKTGTYHQKVPAALSGGTTGELTTITHTTTATLRGRLAHIDFVKFDIQRKEARKAEGKRKLGKKKERRETVELRGFQKVYSDFLFYQNFLHLETQLILPEGKTDTIYIQCAIQQLPAYQPALGASNAGRFTYNLRFMTYSRTVREYLQLRGGTDNLVQFIAGYKTMVQEFTHKPMAHPVIIVIDNDDGAKGVFSIAQKFKVTPSITYASTDPFYYLGENLYIIKTPELPPNHQSCMEDLFHPSVEAVVIDGKIFDAHKDHEAPGKYGKFVFAERVVKPNANTIDFSPFAPLLNRIWR